MTLRALFTAAAMGATIAASALATSVVGVDASRTLPAASYTFSSSPIAPAGSLTPGTSATLTLTAHLSGGAVGPNAIVWIQLLDQHRGAYATLTVNSPVLKTHFYSFPVYEYRVNGAGQLAMTFTYEGDDPHGMPGSDYILAEAQGYNKAQQGTVQTFDVYQWP
jgi:hypothetical protein